MVSEYGKIILVNGTSSSGKTTLCEALVNVLPLPFLHFSSDQFIESGMRPDSRIEKGDFDWSAMRGPFFKGFHHAIPAFAKCGNNMLVEHIVEEASWADEIFGLIEEFDLFVVSVRCSDALLETRERDRGDRTIGEARYHSKTYEFVQHHVEVDGSLSPLTNAQTVLSAWGKR